jgi:predicted phosphodiesterase
LFFIIFGWKMDHNKQENIVQTIGALNGPVLVFGGVYSNLQALEALRELAERAGFSPDRVICTGDIVGYCADPEACVQMVKNWGIHAIAGNVELQLREGEEDCGCNFDEGSRCDLLSRQWYPFAQSQLSADSLAWMKSLPYHLQCTLGAHSVYVLHGSWHNPSEFVFMSTPWPVKAANFEATQADIILAGHCGLPFLDQQQGKTWLNAGVIGMPANDGTVRVWYAILDVNERGEVLCTHHALTYDFATAAERMRVHRLPASYALTLSTGIWDNCDILPETETCAQGKPLF